MDKRKMNREKIMNLIVGNLNIVQKYLEDNNINDLYKDSIFLHAVTFRVEVVCRIILKFRNDLKDIYDEKDFIYFKNLSNLLKDYSKNHCVDLRYFVIKKLPYLNTKAENV